MLQLGCFLNKEQTVMLVYVHGGLLIEMEDNVYCHLAMIGYFLSLLFCVYFELSQKFHFSLPSVTSLRTQA
ncbi:hypothetical protein WQ57_13675 [Mesobacillus campisalis]|uniref:Uncharacterized protein n=1 Tax=Mesobacillus campisalis TaxID=1408103 RepID=A0A0M2STM8_9BACI|nr:hypothetical protein WQ57_13675 [Mesobacillus campisalis]